jgi:Cys-tRNA(Pro)/Cys-tRNA(Cys) deacylase
VKTNAVRLLDTLGIAYQLKSYPVDPQDLSAESVADKVGLPLQQVWKTLVVRGDRHGVCLAVVGGDSELDLKAVARATENGRVEMVPLKEVQPLTGYVRGGVTALACKKEYPVVVDRAIEPFELVSVSAGTRGLQILLAPSDYLRATRARLASIARPKQPGR